MSRPVVARLAAPLTLAALLGSFPARGDGGESDLPTYCRPFSVSCRRGTGIIRIRGVHGIGRAFSPQPRRPFDFAPRLPRLRDATS